MIQDDSLPLTDVLDDQLFEEAFQKHDIHFGSEPEAVYTPIITLWALISQVFYAKAQRTCEAALLRVATLWALLDQRVISENTGAYCRARAKIPHQVVRDITKQIAQKAEEQLVQDDPEDDPEDDLEDDPSHTPEVLQQVHQTQVAGRLFLVDGFTVTAEDTPENQEAFPQSSTQQEGLGFPVIRCVGLTSLRTGLLFDCQWGPCQGKESGETALMWKMLDTLQEGDVLIADRYYCTYWLVGACQQRGVHIVMKNHHRREDRPKGAKRLGQGQRQVTWKRPPRPDWMSEEEYQAQPEEITIRLVDVQVDQAGFRTKTFTVATTLLDCQAYPREWIAAVYQSRWLVELDIRDIKCSLGMDHLRAKSPEMVQTELWSCLLAYNLIRLKMLQSSLESGRDPRSLSFSSTLKLFGTSWLVCAVMGVSEEMLELAQNASTRGRVGHRPDRVEPRANKRRPKVLALLTVPREAARAQLRAA